MLIRGAVPDTGTIAEGSFKGQPGTEFQVPLGLAFGMVYFSRVQAIDTRSGLTSAYSTTQSFTTIAPSIPGLSRLLLDFTDACPSFWGQREFTIDGPVTVANGVWRFTVPPPPSDSSVLHDFALEMVPSGDRVLGTMGGYAVDRLGFPVRVYKDAFSGAGRASLSGAVLADGRLMGTIDGYFNVAHPSFGIGSGCNVTGHAWTLVQSP